MAVILVVDDELGISQTIGSLLEMHGYTPVVSRSGRDALEQMANHDIGLILMDMMMPEMSGLELLQRLRHQHKSQNVPVILMSALPPPDPETIPKVSYQGYLSKPFHIRELLHICAAHITPTLPCT